MSGTPTPPVPWWRSAFLTVFSVVGFIGAIAALAPLGSGSARKFYEDHAVLGWLIAAGLTVAVSTVGIEALRRIAAERSASASALEGLRTQHVRDLATLRGQARIDALTEINRERHEHLSDLEVTAARLGDFSRGGTTRRDLIGLPTDKDFSYELSYAIEAFIESFILDEQPIFDPGLCQLLNEANRLLTAYWTRLSPVLDAPPKVADRKYDLIVLEPPGGSWGTPSGGWGASADKAWTNYYEFVRSLTPLRFAFLESLSPIDKRLRELEVSAARD